MRSRATAYSVLTFLLFAFLPPALSVPPLADAGPFADAGAVQSPYLVDLQSRQAVLSGLTAILTPSGGGGGAPPPGPVLTSAGGIVTAAAVALEARRVLRRSTEEIARAAGKTPASTPVPTSAVSAATQAKAAAPAAVTNPQVDTAAAAALRHRVDSGDTLWSLARRYGVSVDAIVVSNGLASPNQLRPGQILTLPVGATKSAPAKPAAAAPPAARSASPAGPAATPASIFHRVQQGDTLSAIARRYGTSIGAIVTANDLPSAHRLRIGQRLTVPVGSSLGRAAARLDTALAAPPAASARGFIWPTRGLLSSRFGWRHRRHHDGIDLAAPYGSPIYAARAGRVVFAGWYYGYGRAVILNHGDGMTTLYGHASSLLVRTGQSIQRGQLVARVGSSGNSTGSHLHFEVRIGGRAVNPLRYLN